MCDIACPTHVTEANEGLNSTALPGFASYANSSSVTVRHENFTCPVISGHDVDGYSSVRLRLDPSYLAYTHCVCVEGMEVYIYILVYPYTVVYHSRRECEDRFFVFICITQRSLHFRR